MVSSSAREKKPGTPTFIKFPAPRASFFKPSISVEQMDANFMFSNKARWHVRLGVANYKNSHKNRYAQE